MSQFDEHIKSLPNGAIEIQLFPEETVKKFESFDRFYDFVKYEQTFWSKYNKGNLAQIEKYFNGTLSNLNNSKNLQEQNIKQAIDHLKSAESKMKVNAYPCVYSDSTIGKFL